jgi:hypothetical protein
VRPARGLAKTPPAEQNKTTVPNNTPDSLPFDLIWRRAEESRGEGGTLDFDELLYLGEGVLKTYVAGMIAAIGDDTSRQRYKLAYKLVRANSIGDWDDALSEISTGVSAQYILTDAIDVHHELVARAAAGTWVHEAVGRLHGVLQSFMPNVEALPLKVDLRKWFNTFVQLRNKTRGHGAPTEIQKQSAAAELEASTRLVTANCKLFRRQWVYLKRNLSNKYNVLPLGAATFKFDHLRGDKSTSLTDGVYVDFGTSAWVELIDTSVDLVDFFYPNGHFKAKKMEWLSYISGSRRERDATPYLPPASQLPLSHTGGDNSMRVVGRCFANLPPSPKDYIPRAELEAELEKMLENDRHPVVTLVGRGGIGKTSLALRVLHQCFQLGETRI